MIAGEVNRGREVLIRIAIAGPTQQTLPLEAAIDTGFTDYLTVPSAVVETLGLRFRESMAFEMANGEVSVFNLYEARVLWDGRWREVLVAQSEGGPLVGMALMQGFHLSVDVVDGGRVEIKKLE